METHNNLLSHIEQSVVDLIAVPEGKEEVLNAGLSLIFSLLTTHKENQIINIEA